MRTITLASVLLVAAAPVAVAQAASHSDHRTFTVGPGATRTLIVAYPDALKDGDARYAGAVTVLRGRVKVLRKGSAQGGSVYSATVRGLGPGVARVRVTATTTRP